MTVSHCDLSKFELHESNLGSILTPSPDNKPKPGCGAETQSHPERSKRLIYLCPRRIEAYKGDRTRYGRRGRRCDKA